MKKIKFGRVEIILYWWNFYKYLEFYTPALSINFGTKKYDRYIALTFLFLCLDVGVKFIWLPKE